MPVIEVIAQYKPTMLTLSQVQADLASLKKKSAIAACFGLATDDYSPHKRSPSV